jgi:hypothetical protein
MKKAQKPRKDYEKRVDLTPYHRLLRFIRWMNPDLSAEDVLRMLPESDTWSALQLKNHARTLVEVLSCLAERDASLVKKVWGPGRTLTLAGLVPYVVIGRWRWPVWPKSPPGSPTGIRPPIRYPLPEDVGTAPHGDLRAAIQGGLLQAGRYANNPVLLRRKPATVRGLCRLAADLRDILRALQAHGPFAVVGQIADEIDEKISSMFSWGQLGEGGESSLFTTKIVDNSFRAYCFWRLAQLIHEQHVWRLARCVQCEQFFLKTRRDPPDRPSRFCSEPCRRGWHNPRRPKKGGSA